MKVKYDADVDAVIITFRGTRIRDSDEVTPNVIVDFGEDGEVVRVEVLSASRVIDDVEQVTYEKRR
jgi:uncharacterized protein YuzE